MFKAVSLKSLLQSQKKQDVHSIEIYELQTMDSHTHKKQNQYSIRETQLCALYFYSSLLSDGMENQHIHGL